MPLAEAAAKAAAVVERAGIAKGSIQRARMPAEAAAERELELDKNKRHTIEAYVDRLVVRPGIESRLADSVETALRLADGLVKVAPVEGEDTLYSERHACVDCGVSLPEVSPRLFSFNSPHGACPECDGLGACLGECPQGALTVIDSWADAFDEAEALAAEADEAEPHVDSQSLHPTIKPA